jgi:hypothetical protein
MQVGCFSCRAERHLSLPCLECDICRRQTHYRRQAEYFSYVTRINQYNWEKHKLDSEQSDNDSPQLYGLAARSRASSNLRTSQGSRHYGHPLLSRSASSPQRPSVVSITQIRSGARKRVPLILSWTIVIYSAQGMMSSSILDRKSSHMD